MKNIDNPGFAGTVKNAALAVTALSGVAYGCGYLVVRARYRALGADVGFPLVDQAYVYAGFQFVLVLLLSLLVSLPVLILLRWLGGLAILLRPGHFRSVQSVGVVVAGAMTILLFAATFHVSGVLLTPPPDWVAKAALGKNPYGFLLMLGTTVAAAALLLWTRAHFRRAGTLDPLGAALTFIVMLLLVLLPVQHGTFFAERVARKLDGIPIGASGLVPPVWLVDRAADHAILFAHGVDGHVRLVSLKADQLDGVAVVGVGDLSEVVGDSSP